MDRSRLLRTIGDSEVVIETTVYYQFIAYRNVLGMVKVLIRYYKSLKGYY